jgi:hypothetical protein
MLIVSLNSYGHLRVTNFIWLSLDAVTGKVASETARPSQGRTTAASMLQPFGIDGDRLPFRWQSNDWHNGFVIGCR